MKFQKKGPGGYLLILFIFLVTYFNRMSRLENLLLVDSIKLELWYSMLKKTFYIYIHYKFIYIKKENILKLSFKSCFVFGLTQKEGWGTFPFHRGSKVRFTQARSAHFLHHPSDDLQVKVGRWHLPSNTRLCNRASSTNQLPSQSDQVQEMDLQVNWLLLTMLSVDIPQ